MMKCMNVYGKGWHSDTTQGYFISSYCSGCGFSYLAAVSYG